MDTSGLKACPFCGKPGSIWPDDAHSTAYRGGCSDPTLDCPATDIVWGETRDEAVAVWNRRAPNPALAERVGVLERALETFAIMANADTDYLPDEHVVSLTYDDSEIDPDLGGPNTLLGERFMRAFRAARAALHQPDAVQSEDG